MHWRVNCSKRVDQITHAIQREKFIPQGAPDRTICDNRNGWLTPMSLSLESASDRQSAGMCAPLECGRPLYGCELYRV